jgi:hypothetical protein
MIARVLIAAALLAPQAALAAPPPKSFAEFNRLPALGKLAESGTEKDYRFQTYVVGKKQTSKGAIEIYIGQVHMRVQDIAGGKQLAPTVRKWTYAARCSGDANTIGVHTHSILPREKTQTYISIYPGTDPGTADRTWYNVWYAVCLDDAEKYPRNKEE